VACPANPVLFEEPGHIAALDLVWGSLGRMTGSPIIPFTCRASTGFESSRASADEEQKCGEQGKDDDRPCNSVVIHPITYRSAVIENVSWWCIRATPGSRVSREATVTLSSFCALS